MGTHLGTTIEGDRRLRVRLSDGPNQSIRRIVLAVNDGANIVDAGRFAPGVTIDHTFDLRIRPRDHAAWQT